jgi:hypothetical protein
MRGSDLAVADHHVASRAGPRPLLGSRAGVDLGQVSARLALTASASGSPGTTQLKALRAGRTEDDTPAERLEETKHRARMMLADLIGASAIALGGVSLYLTLSSNDKVVERVTRKVPNSIRIGVSPKGLQISAKF